MGESESRCEGGGSMDRTQYTGGGTATERGRDAVT